MIFNARPLVVGAAHPPPGDDDFPAAGFHHSRLDFVREHATDYVRRVLDSIALDGERRHVSVEVRLARIERGRVPGLPGWHIDTVGDPCHPTPPEVHHLFVTGTASLPEFASGPLELELSRGLGPHALMRALSDEVDRRGVAAVPVPSCQVVSYGRLDLHRPTPGRHEERRLLIRVTESDVLRPYDRVVPAPRGWSR